MFQVQRINSINESKPTKKLRIKPSIRTIVFSTRSKNKRTKTMEDCEILGMIFEIISDMLFGSKLEDIGEVELDK